MNAVDIAQPDICYIGGLTRAMRAAGMADRAGKKVVPHSANHSLVMVFTLHMLAAIPNPGRFFEFSIEPNEWVKEIYAPTLEARDGCVTIPDGPGWGVTIHPQWLESAQRQVSEQI
jgi:L-alanine-DL-glutamate epimerase-like enolase superfamily enzyme